MKFVNVYHFLVQKPGMRGIVNGSVFVMVCGFCEFVTVYVLLSPSHTYYIYPPPTNPCHFPFQVSGSLCAGNVPVAILCPVCANSLALPIINVPYFRGIRFRFHYYTITHPAFLPWLAEPCQLPPFFHAQRALYREVSFLHKWGGLRSDLFWCRAWFPFALHAWKVRGKSCPLSRYSLFGCAESRVQILSSKYFNESLIYPLIEMFQWHMKE